MRLLPTTPIELLINNLLSFAETYCKERKDFSNCKAAYSAFCAFVGVNEKTGQYNINKRTHAEIKKYIKETFSQKAVEDSGPLTTVRLPSEMQIVITAWEKNIKSLLDAKVISDSKQLDAKTDLSNVDSQRLQVENQQLKARILELEAQLKHKDDQLTTQIQTTAAAVQAVHGVTEMNRKFDTKSLDGFDTASLRSTRSTKTNYEAVVAKLTSPKRAALLNEIIKQYDNPSTNISARKLFQDLHDELLRHTCLLSLREAKEAKSTDIIVTEWMKQATLAKHAKFQTFIAQVLEKHKNLNDEKPVLSPKDRDENIMYVRNALKKELQAKNYIIPNPALSTEISSENSKYQKLQAVQVPTTVSRVKPVVMTNGASNFAAPGSFSSRAFLMPTSAANKKGSVDVVPPYSNGNGTMTPAVTTSAPAMSSASSAAVTPSSASITNGFFANTASSAAVASIATAAEAVTTVSPPQANIVAVANDTNTTAAPVSPTITLP